ncbi:retrovirus-related pol polyprotein from transposon TNT 1-94 [Tanacetum coccineum]
MFRVDIIEDKGTMYEVQVQLVMGEHKIELGMLIQVKQGRLSASYCTDLALNVDKVFQVDDCDAFNSDVDEAPTAQTMFMANLSSVDPIYDEADTIADMNMPTNDVPAEQAPAIAPPTRMDDQILPSSKWVPIGKSNYVLDVHKSQRNPIFPIAMAILKNTNFFRAFTASSTISAIYIHQFWDTMCFNSSIGLYSCQLDEQWFNLYKDILRDALDITPSNDNNPFIAPPSSDTFIEYVNTLGYPCTLRNVSAMSVNALYQPWRAILSMINMYLTGKTTRYDKPRHPVLQILWASRRKKKTAHLLIPNVRYVGKDGREIFGMPIPDALLTDAIKSAPYYNSYLEHVTEYQRYLNEEHDKADDKSPEPASSQPPKPTPTLTESSKKDQDEGVPKKEPAHNDEEANLKWALELSLKEQVERTQGPAHPVVIGEPDSGRIQPLPEVQGKGKEKVAEEQAAHDLLTLQTPKPKNPADQFIFQRRTPMPTEPSEHADSPSLDAELALTDYETKSEEEVPVIKENLKLLTKDQVILEEPASSSRTFSSLQNLDKDLSFTDQFFVEKPHEEEPGKTNTEAEVQSMVLVPIHQDTSSVPIMTTLVIDLMKLQSDSPLPTSTATTSTITTTTALSPPPPQSTTDPMLVHRICELEECIVDLIQNNLALEERLDKHRSRLYKLENLNIPHQVSKAVDDTVTDAVD